MEFEEEDTARSSIEKMKELLQEKFGFSCEDADTIPKLYYQAAKHSAEIVIFLNENGLDINAIDESNDTALLIAAEHDDVEAMRELLGAGADIYVSNYRGEHVLHRASYHNAVAAIKLYQTVASRLDVVDSDGESALHYAAAGDAEGAVRQLIHYHLKLDYCNSAGITALHRAAMMNAQAVLSVLLEEGGDLEARDSEGKTILYHAVQSKHPDIVALLISKGADIRGGCIEGEALIDIAHEVPQIISLLTVAEFADSIIARKVEVGIVVEFSARELEIITYRIANHLFNRGIEEGFEAYIHEFGASIKPALVAGINKYQEELSEFEIYIGVFLHFVLPDFFPSDLSYHELKELEKPLLRPHSFLTNKETHPTAEFYHAQEQYKIITTVEYYEEYIRAYGSLAQVVTALTTKIMGHPEVCRRVVRKMDISVDSEHHIENLRLMITCDILSRESYVHFKQLLEMVEPELTDVDLGAAGWSEEVGGAWVPEGEQSALSGEADSAD